MPEDVSGAGHAQAPLLIKKVRRVSPGHHGGAWKVAYADMVTALMALFIVLWILSQSEEVIRNVAGYFRDPVGFSKGGTMSVIEGPGAPPASPLPYPPSNTVGRETEGDARQQWRREAQALYAALESLPVFEKYRDQIEMAITSEGLRITLLESNEAPLFRMGAIEPNEDARHLLEVIGLQLRELSNEIAIEGHTDSHPFVGGSKMTNWELSADRANSARRVLERAGIEPGRIWEVRGMADREPYNPDDPADSHNRRVVITLLSEAGLRERKASPPDEIVAIGSVRPLGRRNRR